MGLSWWKRFQQKETLAVKTDSAADYDRVFTSETAIVFRNRETMAGNRKAGEALHLPLHEEDRMTGTHMTAQVAKSVSFSKLG